LALSGAFVAAAFFEGPALGDLVTLDVVAVLDFAAAFGFATVLGLAAACRRDVKRLTLI
jgi:hypothetical protein